ncbi:uncharacterized protein V1518DRAFT_377658 [Limtongia smithiae]|uniref:uncharacterized protein n=1 Tax=Limtongia smithiae TaxID=1125753 RepID=UPI0034CDDB9A
MPADGDQHASGSFNAPRPVVRSWSAPEEKRIQDTLNRELGPEYISKRPGNGGGKVHYIEGWKVINLANEVFGFNGWSSEIRNIQVDHVRSASDGRFALVLSVTIRIILKDGTFHEDVGSGHVENVKSWHMAFDKCKKEATTDALKRTMRSFGPLLGNCLYDSEFIRQITKVSQPSRSHLDMNSLHRAREFRTAPPPPPPPPPPQPRHVPEPPRPNENRNNLLTVPGPQPQQPTPQNQLVTLQSRPAITAAKMEINTPVRTERPDTRESYVSKGFLPSSRPNSIDEMDFGSDLIEDYNEFEDCELQSDELESLILASSNHHQPNKPAQTMASNNGQACGNNTPQISATNMFSNAGIRNSESQEHIRSVSVGGSSTSVIAGMSSKNGSDNISSSGISSGPVAAKNVNQSGGLETSGHVRAASEYAAPQGDSVAAAGVMTPVSKATANPIQFFSARAAEALQKDEKLDDKAVFDPTVQSPSIRKTLDHSVSKPIYRQNASPRLSYDNPRLNANRMVGMPPSAHASPQSGSHDGLAIGHGGRPLLSIKRAVESRPTGGPLHDSTEIRVNGPNGDATADEAAKRQKMS